MTRCAPRRAAGCFFLAGVLLSACGGAPASSTACAFSLPADVAQSVSVAADAVTLSIAVNSTASCSWTARSDAAFMQILDGATGAGNGTVRVSVTANTTARRTGTLIVAGQSITVVQAAAVVTVIDEKQGSGGGQVWAGQSFTIPPGTSYQFVRFNWYDSQGSPSVAGVLYLLTQEYLGTPNNLSTSTPGFVARSEEGADGRYVFPTGMTLSGGAKYWVYTGGESFGFTRVAGSFATDPYPGGDAYNIGAPTQNYRKTPASVPIVGGVIPGVFIDWNFRLIGSPQ